MKLTLMDCYALLKQRTEILDLYNAILTIQFWEEMVELAQEGLIRATEYEVAQPKDKKAGNAR